MAEIRVGLVGLGYWGVNLARSLRDADGTSLVAIADGHPERRAVASRSFPDSAAVETFDDLLAIDLDAVVIATPAGTHADLAERALQAGKHVLVEKPLALSVADGERVRAAAEQAGRTLMVGHTFLYSAPVRELRRTIAAGELGDVQYMYSQRLSLGRIRQDCDALWNFAPHDVSIMLYLLDELPHEVSATGFSFINRGLDDVCFASLRFPSGVGANLHVSWIDPRKTRLTTVVGSHKMAVYNDVSPDQKLWIFDAGVARELGDFTSFGEFHSRTRAGDIHIPRIETVEPLRVEVEAFAAACRSGTPPLADGAHGLAVVRVIAAIEKSARSGGTPVPVAS